MDGASLTSLPLSRISTGATSTVSGKSSSRKRKERRRRAKDRSALAGVAPKHAKSVFRGGGIRSVSGNGARSSGPRFGAPDSLARCLLSYVDSEAASEAAVRTTGEYYMVLPTPDEQQKHLDLFHHEEHPWPRGVLEMIVEELELLLPVRGVRPSWNHYESIASYVGGDDSGIEWEKHPGPLFSDGGVRTKREAWDLTGRVEVLRQLRNNHFDRAPYMSGSGGRAKLTSVDKYEEKMRRGDPVGRFIRIVDVRDVVLCHSVKKALEEVYDWSDFGTALGESYFHNGGRKFAEYFRYTEQPNIYGCGIDFKRCDANFPLRLSKLIFDRLFANFTLKQLPQQVRDYIVRVHCSGTVLSPTRRHEIEIGHGLCSGAPFVSLVESIGVQLMTKVCIRAHLGLTAQQLDERLRIKALGDDQWLTFVGGALDQQTLGGYFKRLFGQEIGPDPPEGHGIAAFEFLGKRLSEHFVPYRDERETYRLLILPERPVDLPEQSLARAVGHLVDNFCNDDARCAIRKYIAHLYDLHTDLSFDAKHLGTYLREDGMYTLLQMEALDMPGIPTDAQLTKLYFGGGAGDVQFGAAI